LCEGKGLETIVRSNLKASDIGFSLGRDFLCVRWNGATGHLGWDKGFLIPFWPSKIAKQSSIPFLANING